MRNFIRLVVALGGVICGNLSSTPTFAQASYGDHMTAQCQARGGRISGGYCELPSTGGGSYGYSSLFVAVAGTARWTKIYALSKAQSQYRAESEAIIRCELEYGEKCSVIGWSEDGCVSLTKGDDGRYFSSSSSWLNDAIEKSLSFCVSESGQDCAHRISYCADGTVDSRTRYSYAREAEPARAPAHYVTNLDPSGDNWLALRDEPSTRSGRRMAKLGPNIRLEFSGRRSGSWMHVYVPDLARSGWVYDRYVGCCH